MTLSKVYALVSAFRSLFGANLPVRRSLQMTPKGLKRVIFELQKGSEIASNKALYGLILGSKWAPNRVILTLHIGYNKRIIDVGDENFPISKIFVNINTDK